MSAAYLLLNNHSASTGSSFNCPESLTFGTCLLAEMGEEMFSLPFFIIMVVTVAYGIVVLFRTKKIFAKVVLTIFLLFQVGGSTYAYSQYQQAAKQYEDALGVGQNPLG